MCLGQGVPQEGTGLEVEQLGVAQHCNTGRQLIALWCHNTHPQALYPSGQVASGLQRLGRRCQIPQVPLAGQQAWPGPALSLGPQHRTPSTFPHSSGGVQHRAGTSLGRMTSCKGNSKGMCVSWPFLLKRKERKKKNWPKFEDTKSGESIWD